MELQRKLPFLNKETISGHYNINVYVHKKILHRQKKKKDSSLFGNNGEVTVQRLQTVTLKKDYKSISTHSSMPNLKKTKYLKKVKIKSSSSLTDMSKQTKSYRTKLIESNIHLKEQSKIYGRRQPVKLCVYRCQFGAQEESCCCSCNSDAMFEVMKSLYDCYKKKNCDNCNCILCGHLPLHERRQGEIRKSIADITDTTSAKVKKEKMKKAVKALEGKSPQEKEQILKELALAGAPLPEGRTASEKELLKKVKTKLGLPPEPTTAAEKDKIKQAEAVGLLVPLEGKTAAEKEKILTAQAKLGIPLPEGRTASEKALIKKVKTAVAIIPKLVPSEKIRKAKASGLITPLTGKTPEEKEKILRGLAMSGIPLPEGKTASEKKLTEKVRKELGLPPEAKTTAAKEKHKIAAAAGLLEPLEGKSLAQKEKILRGQAELGMDLPEGRTASEKALIEKIKAEGGKLPLTKIPTEKLQKAKEAGLLTPLEGKTPKQKEKILRGLVKQKITLPEAKTASEKKLIDKIRHEMGLPPEPKTPSTKERYAQAQAQGLITPLEGKNAAQKEKILRAQAAAGVLLPEGRSSSEKALIEKIKKEVKKLPSARVPSEKIQKAKEAGLLTPLQGKSQEQKEKILRGLVKQGLPLPEGKTSSEKKLIDQIRHETRLPPEPKTPSTKERYARAQAQGLITPLEGKSTAQKEKILRAEAAAGLPLPEGKTASEKALIEKVKAEVRARPSARREPTPLSAEARKLDEQTAKLMKEGKGPSDECICGILTSESEKFSTKMAKIQSEKLRKAKEAGLLTPLEGKTPEQKEKILRAQAAAGLPLREGKTSSEKALIEKIKKEVKQLPLAKIPSEKLRKAKEAGLLTPLQGKPPAQKEKILRGLVKQGLPLPQGKTASEKKLIDKIRHEMRLPPEPKSLSTKERYARAQAQGLITPLEGKSTAQKEKILRAEAAAGLPLPEGKTASEKALIEKVKAEVGARPSARREPTPLSAEAKKLDDQTAKAMKEGKGPSDECICGILTPESEKFSAKIAKIQSEKLRKAKEAGLLTPLEGKTPEQKEKILRAQAAAGLPLREGKTASEKALIEKIKKEGKILPSARVPSEKLRKAKEAGLLTPLAGKTTEQKEKILRGLVKQGIPLPEAKTASDKRLLEKVRVDMGLPPEPATASMKAKYNKAAGNGIIVPLEGKAPAEKEKILKAMQAAGIPLPIGRSPSEKLLIRKVQESGLAAAGVPSAKLRAAREAGLLTPLAEKSTKQKEKILRGLVKQGIPLPEAKTASEKKLIDKIMQEMGLPPEPKTPSTKERYARAQAQGLITPLEGKNAAQKDKILRAQAAAGLPLPEGKTPSEKALIEKIKKEVKKLSSAKVPSEKLQKAKEAGLLTPLQGKTLAQKDKILRGLVKQDIPLPEAKTASEKKLIDKIRQEMGLPPEPKTPSTKERYARAQAQGLIIPLEGKSAAQKDKILRAQAAAGLPLPEGRSPSEKALIEKIKKEVKKVPSARVSSEKLQKAGLLTPLQGKTLAQKEKILRGLVKQDIPLPEAKTASEKKLIDKIRQEMGLPPEPKTPSTKERYARAQAQGLIIPLEGKSAAQKDKILRAQAAAGLSLPEGRSPSEKALIEKIKKEVKKVPSARVSSEKLQKAGLLTPLQGKTLAQKEKILRGLVKQDIPFPEAKTASEKKLIDKIRQEMGLPPEPKTPSTKERYARAQAQGLIIPLEGKSAAQKDKILRAQAAAGLPLPEGRSPSEKALIEKIKKEVKQLPLAKIPSEKLRKAKEAGLLTPLQGKPPAQKEKILRGLVKQGIPLPEGKTASEKKLIDKIRHETRLPPEPKTPSTKERYARAQAQGLITPLEGKSTAQKEKILKAEAAAGLPLPEGKTASEKALIEKVKAEVGARPSVRREATPLSVEARKLDEQTAKVMKEGKGPSDECICGILTSESEKYSRKMAKIPSEKLRKAKEAGLLTPLEGKTPEQKEKILRAQAAAGLPLREGKTASEKAVIEKIKKEGKILPSARVPSEKLRKAKEAGLLTPLAGKSPEQKEKILKGLAERGIPLPEAKTASEKKIMEKIKTELGITPSKRRTPVPLSEEAKKLDEQTAKVMKESKGPADECICGIVTPESEKFSVRAGKPPSKDKLRKAKAAGLLTPLEGKSAAQKEKILKGLAEAGIPLPEGKTASEKALVKKVKTEYGIPPEAKTAAEKEIVRKAKAEGLLTPLEGKTRTEKERILKGLAEAGLPIPEGKTASEKALIRSIRTAAGLPPEPTPSEKAGKIKKKTRKVGEGAVSKKAIAKAVGVKSKAGIVEEFQDVLKTTTCERGCGCDKKKIRFKHSYVKIRVTSPDISSLCPCPDECVPGVKGGVFVDNEGIKVTVGSAIGFPSFTNIASLHTLATKNKNFIKEKSSKSSEDSLYATDDNFINIKLKEEKRKLKSYKISEKEETIKKHNDCRKEYIMIDQLQTYEKSEEDSKESNNLVTKFSGKKVDSDSSFDSLILSMTESSLSFSSCSTSSSSTSIATISVISLNSESISPTSSHYICIEESFTSICNSDKNDEECFTSDAKYDSDKSIPRKFKAITDNSNTAHKPIYRRPHKLHEDENVVIFNLSQLDLRNKEENRKKTSYCKHNKPIIILKNVSDTRDVMKMVRTILSKENIEQTSSVIIVAPTSTDEDVDDDNLSDTASSTICIRMSKNYFNWSKNVIQENVHCSKPSSSTPYGNLDQCQGIKFTSIGRHHIIDSAIPKNRNLDQSFKAMETLFEKKKQGIELETLYLPPSLRRPTTMLPSLHPYTPPPVHASPQPYSERCGFSMDTTQHRPCCCGTQASIKKNKNKILFWRK